MSFVKMSACAVSGASSMMTSAHLATSAGVSDLEALLGDLGPRLGALLEADLHLDTGVAQAQRVRVALAAVADDTDLASLDDGQVGIVVIEHLN